MRTTVRTICLAALLGGAACSQPARPPAASRTPPRAALTASGTGASRSAHVAALLPDGRVLLAGGMVSGAATRSAQIFDPSTGAFTTTGQLLAARAHATATVLLDGRVLVAGGDDGAGTALATAELYDPVAGTFSAAGPLGAARASQTATRLSSGHVLVMGGRAAGAALASVEEYIPAAGGAGSWAANPHALQAARAGHTATLLGDGTLLVAGGEDGGGTPILQAQAAERFDPASGSTYTAGAMNARTRHTATLLPGGAVLLVGGWDGAVELSSADVYRPGTDDFATGPALGVARADATSTLLPDGRVVVAGGNVGGSAVNDVDVYAAGAASALPVGHLAAPRGGHVATLLPAGRILLTGGGLPTAEQLDRAADGWTALSPSGYVPSHGHTATLLSTGGDAGKVLVVGGIDPYGGWLQSAQLFDPTDGSLTSLPPMGKARAYHTATLLPDGDVLIAGGKYGATSALNTAKRYHAATRTWSDVPGTLGAPRASHTATLLPNGKVLLAGGEDGTSAHASADLYDPEADALSPSAGTMSAARAHHASAMLRDGRVLVAGGDGTATADVYDPVADAFTPVGSMAGVRAHFTATPLPDGRVLVAGGTDGTTELGTAEIFDGTASFPSSSLTLTPRLDHAAASLPTGEVIVAGGQDASGFLDVVERYEPASGRFVQSGISYLDQERDLFTATLLPSGALLAWGGYNSGASLAMPDVYAAYASLAAPPPDLAGSMPLSSPIPGATLSLSPVGGASFIGDVDTGSSDARESAANQPVFVLTRQEGDGVAFARTASFAAGSAQVVLPDALPKGWWWIRAIVAGAPGKALPFYVLDPFRIAPADPTVPPRGSVTFTASGGSGAGYSWLVTQAGSASAETPLLPAVTSTGATTASYQAGATPLSTDVVQVTDSLGNAVTTTVQVGPGVTISPKPAAAPPLGTIAFSATGGSGSGWIWSFQPGGNRSGGSIDTSSGAYRAGPVGGVSDDLQVVDSLGNHDQVSVQVTTPVVIDPTTASTTPLGAVAFSCSGGMVSGGYTWSLSVNRSGGSVDASGNYVAGRTGSVTDTVRVTDSLGSYAEAVVTVGPAVSIAPAAPTTPPRGSITFTASGGTGAGFGWSLSTNASGGSIDATTGAYVAGATPDVTDVVQVQDSLGNLATVSVSVGPGVTITPTEPGAYPGQTVAFQATGGSGSGFVWKLVTVASQGGTIDPTTGLYTAGTKRGATDVVQVTDSLGNQATAEVVIWPDWRPAGSGCSSLEGGSGALGLILLALWLAWRGRSRRRRPARGAAAALVLLAAGVARAQTPPTTTSFLVDRFQPEGGAYDLLGIESAQVAGGWEKTFRLYGNYASRPLVVVAPGMDKVSMLKSQTAADLTFALGLYDWAEVSVAIPGVVSQSRQSNRFLPPGLRPNIAQSGFSDIRVVPKARLLEWRKLRVGVALPVSLPTGDTRSYLGQGGVTASPRALFELDDLGPVRLLLNAGAIFRQERQLVDLKVGNAFTYGAGVEWPFLRGAQTLAALATFNGEAGMSDHSAAARPMELLGGLRWTSPQGLLVTLGGGPGIGKGYGTPEYRVFAEIGFSTAPAGRLAEKPPAEKPVVAKEEPKPEEPGPVPAKAEPPKPAEPAPQAEEKPAATPEPAPAAAPAEPLRIESRVFFDFNKKEIKAQYRPLLREVAQRILAEPRMRVVRIEGHADDLGPPEYNLWLSEERSKAVRAFLVKEGVPPSRVTVIGFGKARPLLPGRSAKDRAKNRRVEFTVQEQ
ncbi:MAG TPA: kelch repeat-containing protein [Anaeromyxobacter sp.]|nr:kelch repeat-containing protein [Anaeromyxobacter sp.]